MKITKIGIAGLALFIAALGTYAWLEYGLPGTGKQASSIEESEEKLSLHFFISGSPGSRLPEPEDDFVRKTIESKFNVNLNVTAMPPGDEYNATIASLLAANDPPDMWLNISPDGGAKYTLDNVLADMTYFVTPLTMPNYFKYWMNEKELREYQVHNKFARAPIPYDKKSYRSYYIRKDWLSRLGLDIPKNYAEYVKSMEAFTFRDPDGNGKNDTYGFTTAGAGTSISVEWPEFIKNGLIFPSYFENDKLVDMQMDLRVGQVTADILKVMNEGLIDPDWFLNIGNQHVDKAVQGKVGIILGNTMDFAFDSNPESLQARSKAVSPTADWVPFNPFGNQPLRTAVSPDYPFVFSNNAAGLNPEKLKKTAKILDWLAGEEGFLLTHYGIEGKHYAREGNTITLKPDVLEKDIKKKGDFLKIWSFFTPNAPDVLGLTVVDSRITERDKMIYRTVTAIPVYEGLGTTLTPPLGINVEIMRARQNELQVKMIFSDKSGERWPEYRKEVMTLYEGSNIFRQYEEKIREARKNR
ncbi:hypothetical protein [Paenibacillus sp. MBLB4367]|uniref:hypothetical protein n=1 Tax=Paenibacillus sp. MBLB4367 TaxID=3384767 RepID=UPI0039083DCE